MPEKDSLGELELLVMLAALRLGPRSYGLSITEEIVERAGRSVVRASVYVTLRRLEKQGLISTREEPDSTRPRPRRLVSVTPDGLTLLRRSRAGLERMWSGLDEAMGEST